MAAAWRTNGRPWSRGRVVAAGAAAVLAIWVSLPADAAPVMAAQMVGTAVLDEGNAGDNFSPAAFRRRSLLNSLFPKDYEPAVPDETYGGSALAWGHYARHGAGKPADINYVLVSAGGPAPAGMRLHAVNDAGSLYVRSDDVWQQHRAMRPATPAGGPLYRTPRGILFWGVSLTGGPSILDLPKCLEGLGIDVYRLAQRLGRKP